MFSAVNTALIQSSAISSQAPSPPITQPPSSSSSSNSVAALRDQFRGGAGMSNGAPSPPLPPTPAPSSNPSSASASPKSLLRDNVKPIILNGGPLNPPAPPPHRSCPPPPPPQRQSSNVSSKRTGIISAQNNRLARMSEVNFNGLRCLGWLPWAFCLCIEQMWGRSQGYTYILSKLGLTILST